MQKKVAEPLDAKTKKVLLRSSDDLSPIFNKCSYNNGDLQIDFESHLIKKNGFAVKLTPNEFRILSVLINNQIKFFLVMSL